MQQGLDYAGSSPGAAAVKAAGFSFVARYLSRYSAKTIKKPEYDDMTGNGVGVVLVFEDYANQALNGYAQGVSDAQVALAQANALGWPADRPIHFAVDFDIAPDQKPVAGEYMKGVASVIGLSRTGAYGGYWWIKYCDENNLAAPNARWQAVAWSGGMIHPTATLFQQLAGTNVNGTDCDINQQLKADFGQNNGESNDMAIIQDADNWRGRANKSFRMIRGRDMDPAEFTPWIGQDFLHLIEALEDNPEADSQVHFADVGRYAINNDWENKINSLIAQVADEQKQLDAALAAEKQAEDELKNTPAATTPVADPTPVVVNPPSSNSFMDWLSGILKSLKLKK